MNRSAAGMNYTASVYNETYDAVTFTENEEAESYKCKRFNYVPLGSRMYVSVRFLRYLCAICSVILALILIIVFAVVYTKHDGTLATSSNTGASNSTSDFLGKVFLLINDTKLMKFDHNTSRLDLVLEAPENSTIGEFVVHDDNSIHWTENKASRLVSQSDKDVKVLLEEKRFKPEGLVLDQTSGNIYVVDKNAGTLIVTNIRNGYYAILLTDLVNAQDVVLDSEEGCLFILQNSHSILRANMDGSEPKDVMTNNGITALTVDTNRKRIYWITDYKNIESSNYDGETRKTAFTDIEKITSITVLGNHLLWIRPNKQQSTNLLSCKIDSDNTCKERASHEINATGNANSIRGYSTVPSSVSNPCQVNNGGCEQLCLPSGKNKSSCVCRMGWELSPDNHSCHEVRDFVLYPYGDVVRTRSLDGKQEIFWPTPYKVKKLEEKTEIDFDYDSKNDDFYFSDDHHIHRMKLKSYDGQEIVLTTNSSNTIIEDIAYDWFTGNIYYGQRNINTSLEHSVMVFNSRLGEAYRKTVDNYGGGSFGTSSYGIAVHPMKGYLFLNVKAGTTTDIFRVDISNSTFSKTYHFYADGVRDHRFFTIDYATDLLYVIQVTSETTTWIAYTSIDSSKMKFTADVNIANARTISVHQGWTYLSNFSSIWRFDTMTGENAVKIAPRIEDTSKQIVGVRIVSEEVQFTGSDNPCAKNNGGCEQFCFAGSKATCACRDGQTVKDDERCY